MTNSWNIVSSKSKKYDSDKFLRVKPDCKLKVRLIGQPVKVVRVFSYDKKCISIDNEEMGKQLMQKHADKISNVSVRYACWCIDRNVNTMKVLDMPTSVARSFGSRAEIVGKKISSSKEGCDWAIGTNGKTGKDVRYNIVFLEETPLTQAEQEMVKNRMADRDSFDLTMIFKSCSYEEAEERL